MGKLIRKCRLADSSRRDEDLRIYEDIIVETINNIRHCRCPLQTALCQSSLPISRTNSSDKFFNNVNYCYYFGRNVV